MTLFSTTTLNFLQDRNNVVFWNWDYALFKKPQIWKIKFLKSFKIQICIINKRPQLSNFTHIRWNFWLLNTNFKSSFDTADTSLGSNYNHHHNLSNTQSARLPTAFHSWSTARVRVYSVKPTSSSGLSGTVRTRLQARSLLLLLSCTSLIF